MRNKIMMIMLCLSIVMGSLGETTYAACPVDAVKGNSRKVNVNSFSVDETVVDEDASSREKESDSAHNSSDEDADLLEDYPGSGMEDDDSEENESSYGDTEQHSEIEADEDVSESTENNDSTSEIAEEDLLEEPLGDVELGTEDEDLNYNEQSGDSYSDSADTSGSATEAQATIDDSEERTGDSTADENATVIDAETEFTEKEELCNDANGNFTYTVSENEVATTKEDYDIYTFDANGGYFFSGETVYEEKVKPGNKAYGATPTIDDEMKIFGGWSRKKDATSPEFENYWDAGWPNEPCYVYAVWVDACTITLDANGGFYYDSPTYDEVTERQIKVKKNILLERIEQPSAPNSEKIFGGWSLKANGEIEDEIYPTDGMTLYAIWVTPYRITFSPNGGYYWPDNTMCRTHKLVPGKKVGLIDHPLLNETLEPLNHDEDKILLGWKLENKGIIITDIREYIPDGDCTFYAVWSNDEIKITSIQIDQNNLSVDKGWAKQISAHVVPDDATNKTITWVSSDETVVNVDKNGKVTGIGAGTATITATAIDGSGVTAECKVTVIEKFIVMTDVSSVSYNKLNVSWEKCEGADGYMVYRKGNGEAYALVKSLSGEDSISFTNSVVSGAKYTYKVSAYKMDGTKKRILAQTGEMSGTALPAAPVMKSTGMAAFNKIKVIWTKVSGCAGYVIYRSIEENGKYSALKTVTMATATEYSNIVQDGQTYYYKIRAFVEVNGKKVYGDYSKVLSGDVIDAPPVNFRLEQRAATKIIFNWDKVEDAEGYVIYRYFQDTNKCKAIKNITSKDTLTYSFKVDADADYQFTMRAFRVVNGKKVYSDYSERISN